MNNKEVFFTWKGKNYLIQDDMYEIPPKMTHEEVKKRLEDAIELNLYDNVNHLVIQGIKYKWLVEVK